MMDWGLDQGLMMLQMVNSRNVVLFLLFVEMSVDLISCW